MLPGQNGCNGKFDLFTTPTDKTGTYFQSASQILETYRLSKWSVSTETFLKKLESNEGSTEDASTKEALSALPDLVFCDRIETWFRELESAVLV